MRSKRRRDEGKPDDGYLRLHYPDVYRDIEVLAGLVGDIDTTRSLFLEYLDHPKHLTKIFEGKIKKISAVKDEHPAAFKKYCLFLIREHHFSLEDVFLILTAPNLGSETLTLVAENIMVLTKEVTAEGWGFSPKNISSIFKRPGANALLAKMLTFDQTARNRLRDAGYDSSEKLVLLTDHTGAASFIDLLLQYQNILRHYPAASYIIELSKTTGAFAKIKYTLRDYFGPQDLKEIIHTHKIYTGKLAVCFLDTVMRAATRLAETFSKEKDRYQRLAEEVRNIRDKKMATVEHILDGQRGITRTAGAGGVEVAPTSKKLEGIDRVFSEAERKQLERLTNPHSLPSGRHTIFNERSKRARLANPPDEEDNKKAAALLASLSS